MNRTLDTPDWTHLDPYKKPFQVPHIPGENPALVIDIAADNLESQCALLPWTLYSLLENTDIVTEGVHLYIACTVKQRALVEHATRLFSLQNDHPTARDNKIHIKTDDASPKPFILLGEHGLRYTSICLIDIHFWAFRDKENLQQVPLGYLLKRNWGWGCTHVSLQETPVDARRHWMPMTENAMWKDIDSVATRRELAQHLLKAGEMARALDIANQSVYGDRAKPKEGEPTDARYNVARHFFNEWGLNWHLDTSILQYQALEVRDPHFRDWCGTLQTAGFHRDAIVAFYLLMMNEHAYNFSNTLTFGKGHPPEEGPFLLNIKHLSHEGANHLIPRLQGKKQEIHYVHTERNPEPLL